MQVTLGHLLSVTTDILCLENLSDLSVFLSKMVGENLYTHSLIRAANEIKPHLLEQFPFLSAISDEDLKGENCLEKVNEFAKLYGNKFEVFPLHHEDHQFGVTIEQAMIDAGVDPATKQIIEFDLEDLEQGENDDANDVSPYGDIGWKPNN